MKQQIKPRARFNPKLEKKLPYYCCCLVGRSVDLETTFFLFFHILIFYLKLCFCSYNKTLTSSFFWLLLGNQSKSEIDLRWKISALFLSYCLLFWNDLEFIYIIYFLSLNFFFHYISWLFIWKEIDIFKVHVALTSFFLKRANLTNFMIQCTTYKNVAFFSTSCGLPSSFITGIISHIFGKKNLDH